MSKENPKEAVNGSLEADVDLDAIVRQRAEARAGDDVQTYDFDWTTENEAGEEERSVFTKTEGDTFTFRFNGKVWHVRDPQFLLDEEKAELDPITYDTDVAAWYLGETRYDQFLSEGGESWMFLQAFSKYQKKVQDEVGGNPTRQSRSSRKIRRASKRR